MHEPVLLLWDGVSGHWHKDVLIFSRLIKVELMKIPPGYTCVCQLAHVAWNRPLKEHPRKQWTEFLLDQVHSTAGAAPFKMTPPTRRDIIQGMKRA
ncbi:hypothetical protein PI124_g3312 [Phytophthora idaei]|nr:hypothetical protein PI125_g2834 [Phytophthora idaei]KAG3169800.1 hypothetical protein PI126_g2642 [Phytophthora idaei]KAG3252110.1 hypothetical protein PI124_g3312 [Phytophthora idaei]